ncbi:hypothetical protein HN011_010230 [Eciton burchellii]|nr:hypothetical protein HN011_010230 [Eciton burchellii]
MNGMNGKPDRNIIGTTIKMSRNGPMYPRKIKIYQDKPFVPGPADKDRDDICELHELAEMLEYGYKSSPYNFEAYYLNNFSDKPFPGETFVPKTILNTLLEKHAANRQMIREKKIPVDMVTYRYTYKKENRRFKFHNNMELFEDMLIVLYLHLFITKIALSTYPVKTILDILHTKYNLQRTSDFKEKWRIVEPGYEKPIPMSCLMHVFPSIVISMFQKNLGYIARTSQIIFNEVSDLPQAIYHYTIAAIIPRKLKNPPIALLMFIMKKYAFYFDIEELKIPLKMLYERIMSFYENDIYPEDMKCKLCKCWNIVKDYQNELCFDVAIMNANKHAKRMLETMMIDDPDLKDILSKI